MLNNRGTGSKFAAISPPFNNNFTPLPKFDFNQYHEDEIVYGGGHVSKPKSAMPWVSYSVHPISKPVSANGSSSCVVGGVVV